MSGYKFNTMINVHDLDYNGVTRASAILKYLQTAADFQLTENGMSYTQLKEMGRAFVISRIRLEIDSAPKEGLPLIATTFPCESRGYSFLRCFKLEQDGVAVAKASSLWALLDTEKRTLVRVSDFQLGLPLLPPLDLEIPRIKLPESMEEVGNYPVRYDQLDRNMHMNNTRYADMYSEYLPLSGKRIRAITVNYANEARGGDELTVMRGERDGLYYFRTVRGDGKVNSEAEIELSDI